MINPKIKNQIAFVLTVLLITASTACAQSKREDRKTSTSSSLCAPIETRTANVPEQKPAFAGQTRGCAVKSNVAFDVTVLAKGLDKPWAVEPLPNGDLLITEKSGKLLGHSSVTITLDTYSHVSPTMQKAATEKLEKMLYGK